VALTLTIDGGDETAHLRWGSLSITQTEGAREGRCNFTMTDFLPSPIATVVVADGATTYFSGEVRSLTGREYSTGHSFVDVTAHDTRGYPLVSDAPFNLSDVDAETTYTRNFDSGYYPTAGWWRLGEPSGVTAVDAAAVQNGTYQGSPTLGVTGAMPGTTNTAVTLNGTTQWIDVGSARLKGLADFAIAAWAKTSYSGASQVIYAEHAAGGDGASLIRFYIATTGRPTFQYRDAASTVDTIVPTSGNWADGAWHHFAALKLGTTVHLSVDGTTVKSAVLTATNTLTGTLVAKIGRDPGATAYYFNGSLDEVMTWDYYPGGAPGGPASLFPARDSRRYLSLVTQNDWDGAASFTSTAVLSTLAAGLLPGQTFAYASALLSGGIIGIQTDITPSAIIQEVTTTWLNATTPLYTVKVGDPPLTLAKAIKP
jgi:hypothetical protein